MSEQFDEEQLKAGFWVGDWLVEPLLNRLSRGEEVVQLEPKVMEVLLCLAHRPGKTITKERFLEQVWADTVVTEDVLSRCISELRRVFGDDARDPHFIETIRKRGYRLIAPAALSAPEPEARTGARPVEAEGRARSVSAWPGRMGWGVSRWIGLSLSHPVLLGLFAGVLVVVLGGVFWFWRVPAETVEPPQTVPFTSFPGEELDPALSPEGERVAFVRDENQGSNLELYIKQTGAETPLQITDNETVERSPVWSPDGHHLAFVRIEEGQYSLFVVPAIGGSERKVASFGGREIQGLDWSPDGQTLAVSAQEAPHGTFRLYLLAVDRGEAQPLTSPPRHYQGDLAPAFSPDGRRLAFARSVGEAMQDLYVVPVEGGEPRRLTFDDAQITGLDWMADGQQIVFASQRGGNSGLWRVPASGGEPTWITTASEGNSFHHLSVARQAERMVYVQRSYDVNIWRLWRSQGSYRPHELIFSTRWDANPAVSPAGDRIAFASNRSGSYEIWVCDRDGANPMQLTSFGGAFTHTPRWSPDGRRLAFVAHTEGRADLYVIDAEGGGLRRLSRPPSDEMAPSWSRDGSQLYFASNRSGPWQIWKVPADSGAAVQVTMKGGRAAFEDPEGTSLYYVKPDTSGIWQMPLLGGQERQVVASLASQDWGNWAVVETGIYFVDREGGSPVLVFYDVARERTVPVAELKAVPGQASLAVAPEGTWFLYTQVDRNESDILLVEHFR